MFMWSFGAGAYMQELGPQLQAEAQADGCWEPGSLGVDFRLVT